MTPTRLAALAALAEARTARDLARLDALRAADRAAAEAARALTTTHARDMAEGAGAAPLPLLDRRLVWADAHLAALRATRARLAAEITAARASATISLGKQRALDRLHDDAATLAHAVAQARAERDAPPREGVAPVDKPVDN